MKVYKYQKKILQEISVLHAAKIAQSTHHALALAMNIPNVLIDIIKEDQLQS
jgi:hypothetical protein